MIPGTGTLVNVIAVLAGTTVGVLVGHRLPERTRTVVTDGLGLVTLLIAGISAAHVTDADLSDAVGSAAPMLIVLGSVLIGGIVGSLLRIEDRLEDFGGLLQRAAVRRFGASSGGESRERFVQGFVVSSLVFCVGPLTILGSLDNGLRGDITLLATKSLLDGVASVAFAAAMGAGVYLSILTVLVVQGGIALGAFLLAGFFDPVTILVLTSLAGITLLGVGLRLLELKQVRLANFLPGLIVAPLLVRLFDAARAAFP